MDTRGDAADAAVGFGAGREPRSENCREIFRDIMKEDATFEERKKRKTEKQAEKDKEDAYGVQSD